MPILAPEPARSYVSYMTDTRTFEARYLGKCRSCKCAVRVTATVTVRKGIGHYGRSTYHALVTFPNGQSYGSDSAERVFFKCLCGRNVEFRRLRGIVTAHKCNVKCLASTSGVCECSCGGKNHGAAHDAA